MSLEAHFFRHEHGRLCAALVRRVGVHQVEAVEDAVQLALAAALESWPRTGVPEDRSAWLFRVAWNHFVGEARQRTRRQGLARAHAEELEPAASAAPEAALAGDLRDDLLRLLFVCCDPALSIEAQLVLALRTLCGFEVREIAERLFASEASVYKRLARARARLREVGLALDPGEAGAAALAARLPAVQAILYLLFTEGYLSARPDGPIRRELCDDALWLAHELAEHPVGARPETYALVALLHLQRARLAARVDGDGGLVLLEAQERARWDAAEIHEGLAWLARSAEGEAFSRYHAEAGIAAEHALAPSFAQTRWDRIIACYELLEALAPSPLHTLNAAVALAELHGPAAGLARLETFTPPPWLAGSHLWSAVLADLHRRAGHEALAEEHRRDALARAPSEAVRAALARRLGG